MPKSPFSIDLHALDVECQRQPDLVHMYAVELADAKKALAKAEKQLKAFREKIAGHARKFPEKYKIRKVTNDAVNTAAANHPRCIELVETIADLSYSVDMAWANVNAISAKQTSLTDLVRLHGQSYFDTPRLTEEGVASIKKEKARRKGGVRSDA